MKFIIFQPMPSLVIPASTPPSSKMHDDKNSYKLLKLAEIKINGTWFYNVEQLNSLCSLIVSCINWHNHYTIYTWNGVRWYLCWQDVCALNENFFHFLSHCAERCECRAKWMSENGKLLSSNRRHSSGVTETTSKLWEYNTSIWIHSDR